MILKRFYDEKLAQASYLIGCAHAGEAIIIDANRDAQQYLKAAKAEGLRITHVTETHIHADFVSGSRELAARTGAKLNLSDEGDANWKYSFARDSAATLLKDGDSISIGDVSLRVVHTPGHTPEHLAFLVTDTAHASEPMGMVTGDFVFVGDVGRPDLLEKSAKMGGTMESAARTLHGSLERLAKLPDWLQIWPGHGAGSACGKGMSAVPHSTLGYERRFNWAFSTTSQDEFVRMVLAGQPEPPKYFAEMKRINKEGPKILNGFSRPPLLDGNRFREVVTKAETLVVDVRSAAQFAEGHIPGTINIPLNKSFTTWAGWLIPYDRDFHIIVDGESRMDESVRDLGMIGLDRVAGYVGSEAIQDFSAHGGELAVISQTSPRELAQSMAEEASTVIDVRGRAEWEAGHIPGASNVPLGYLTDHLSDVPRTKPIVLHCQGGGRSSIAASVLSARGFTNVVNLAGGYSEWLREGLPVQPAPNAGMVD
ncbi:MAG: MBL fold metallo-hydrolase [Anaerolineae bacterium]|nr:MBL fold metallo-hydrolase [Gemmatimonadaceae bacterium]